ncbi:MAG: N-acetylmuramoyl-L-alanine amidase [Erysipelotrichales bacterium]|nr:N-acetylmuramoyl-L-alanine amidase [Erysipelotrichales bacterium]
MKHRYVFVLIIILEIALIGIKHINRNQKVSLFGINFVIDPGHGGKDNGSCYNEVLEDEINLKIATKLMDISINEGAISSLTRVGDYDLSSENASNHKREDLKARVDYINNSGAQFFVSIHMNSYPSNISVNGPMVYYEKNNEESKHFAEEVSKVLNDFASSDKPIHYDDFYLFRNTKIPGILVECGFISNSKDRNNLTNDLYQQKFAKKLYEGIENYTLGERF